MTLVELQGVGSGAGGRGLNGARRAGAEECDRSSADESKTGDDQDRRTTTGHDRYWIRKIVT
jgi:hypothetical protein